MHFAFLAPYRARTFGWVFLPQERFQPIERHVGQDWGDDAALWRAIFCSVPDGFLHVACFEPLPQNGVFHWDVGEQPVMADGVKAGFDVPFKYPWWHVFPEEYPVALGDSVRTTAF